MQQPLEENLTKFKRNICQNIDSSVTRSGITGPQKDFSLLYELSETSSTYTKTTKTLDIPKTL